MLKALRNITIAAAAMALLTGGAQAAGMEKPVAARQAVMKLNSFYMGQLGGMAKLDTSGMWLKGSGNDKLGNKTRAKPEIWSTYPEVAKKSKALKMALENLVTVAGSGLEGLRGGIGAVGKACGGCHKPFREKKK